MPRITTGGQTNPGPVSLLLTRCDTAKAAQLSCYTLTFGCLKCARVDKTPKNLHAVDISFKNLAFLRALVGVGMSLGLKSAYQFIPSR